jgi:hypothetical protein
VSEMSEEIETREIKISKILTKKGGKDKVKLEVWLEF